MPSAPTPCAHEVEGIGLPDPFRRAGEGQADGAAAEEEGQHEERVAGPSQTSCELSQTMASGLNGSRTAPAKLPTAAREKRTQAAAEGGPKARQEQVARERQGRAAGAEAQKRHRDDHVGEVVPARDREEPHQEDLIGKDGRRDHRHRQEQGAAHDGAQPPPAPVKGHELDGQDLPGGDAPVLLLLYQHQHLRREGGADGDHHPAPG
jgi:hypothetical protein